MKIELLKSQNIELSKLELNKGQIEGLPKNPRLIKDAKFDKLKKSIEDNPEMLGMREVLVFPYGSKYVIIGGNMRFQACKELQFETVPCKVLDKDMTAEQLRAITIKDNVGFGEHDWELLANEWDSVELEEWGLEVPNFETEDTILEAEEDDYEEPENLKVDVVLGDLIEFECTDGRVHRLICGDSTDSDTVAKLMNGEKADMVFTDPPYGVNYEGGTGSYANGKIKSRTSTTIKNDLQANLYNDINPIIHLFLKEGAIYVWYADKFIQDVLAITEGLELRSIINWYKIKQGFGDMGSNYHTVSEPCLYLVKGKSNFVGENNETNIWELQRPQKNNLHPTQKPIELPERAIRNSSLLNNIVLDLFLGSGSTMVAAHQLKRKCYGMELEPKYCQVIIDRMTKLDSTIKVKINSKEYANT